MSTAFVYPDQIVNRHGRFVKVRDESAAQESAVRNQVIYVKVGQGGVIEQDQMYAPSLDSSIKMENGEDIEVSMNPSPWVSNDELQSRGLPTCNFPQGMVFKD